MEETCGRRDGRQSNTTSHCPTGVEEYRHFLIKLHRNGVNFILVGLTPG